MSATDELRRMLDEHDEYYKTSGNKTWWGRPIDRQTGKPINVFHYQAQPMGEDRLFVELQLATPAQAIAATVKRCTCRLHDCDGSFSSVNRPVWRCDCGAFMTQYTDATTYHKPRFCPNCGRRCVG